MEADGWSRVLTERFEGEDMQSYRVRAARIEQLITGFRMGRFGRDAAEHLEQELVRLQEYPLSAPVAVARGDLAIDRRFRVHAGAARA
jgi:hypothetical protein